MAPLKRAALLDMFLTKTAGSKIFISALTVYYPLDSDWSSRNAETFLTECPVTINAILGFIQLHAKDENCKFPDLSARAVLTMRCGDVREFELN